MVETIEQAIEKIRSEITENSVLLYMKGTPEAPHCGFSASAAAILKSIGIDFKYVNVLDSPIMREAIKRHSDWPTFPQLYVQQELIGGCDIMKEMYVSGELKKLFEEKNLLNVH